MDTVKRTMDLLDARNMSLYQLTQKSGIARATITQTEKRGGQLKIDTIERICEALGITLSEFFLESDQEILKKRTIPKIIPSNGTARA
ncbi:MAG: helix-turn-helix transcriptional regulator [Alphaproteobacteria bacterium]|nr:helix-turn-helix transcriptional regulator [Alphaproteobacteria bacterium]